MTPTVAAERIIAVKMNPCSSAKTPWIQVSLFWNSPMSDSLNGSAGAPDPRGAQAVLGHQRAPGADAGKQADDHRRRVLARRRLERLRG